MVRKCTLIDFRTTSYVLDIVAESSVPEWEHLLYIDPMVVNSLASYIITHQLDDGAFPPTSGIYDMNMEVSSHLYIIRFFDSKFFTNRNHD